MKRILNIKSQLCNTGLIKTRSGKLVSSSVLMPSKVYSSADDRRQFHGELRESARSGLPTNYWSFQYQVDGDVGLRINISGVDPISGSSEVFGPLFGGDELFIHDPAHLFPGSERIQVILTTEPASAAEQIRVEVFSREPVSGNNLAAEDKIFISSATGSLSFVIHGRDSLKK